MKFVLTFSLLFPFYCFSQWNSNTVLNTPVCTASDKQIDPRTIDNGYGGVFVAWKDYRNGGVPDIYIQNIDSLGFAKWTNDGVALCTDPADQSTPAITTDMANGAIVAWSDWRSGVERDIYAQRISPTGAVLWITDGVIVTNKPEREHNEKIISDDAGGAIIVWEQQNNSTYLWEIWAQHINSSGNILWTSGGIKLAQIGVYYNLLNPKIQKDNKGGAFVTWQDNRNGVDYNIYAQHVSSTGTLKWGTTGVLVSGAFNAQTNPKIDPDSVSGGIYVCWTDKRNNFDYDIYCQLIDSTGTALWTTNGVGVCQATGNQSAVDILSNPKVNGIIIAWKDDRAGNEDIYTQKLSHTGAAQWTSDGLSLCSSITQQLNPNITGDGLGGAIICWQDSTTTSGWDIKAQHINANGSTQWATDGVSISNATGSQIAPKNVSDKFGGCITVWQDKRSGTFDIYCQKTSNQGIDNGIKFEKISSDITSFPNPFEDQLKINFELPHDDKILIRIYNSTGEEFFSFSYKERLLVKGQQTILINTSNMKPGVYLLNINGNYIFRSVKLIKN